MENSKIDCGGLRCQPHTSSAQYLKNTSSRQPNCSFRSCHSSGRLLHYGGKFYSQEPLRSATLSPATRGCPRRQYDHADVGQGRFIDQMVGPRAQILLMYRWTSLLPINDFSCHCQVSSNDIPWHGGRMCFFWQLPYAIKVVSPYKSNLRRPGPLGVSFSEIS